MPSAFPSAPAEPLLAELAARFADGVPGVIEAPRWSFIKRDPQGAVDLISPLPCPFNYGSVPGTTSGDGDPLDVVVLGERLARGATGRWPVLGVVDFVDNGDPDPKLICGPAGLRRRDVAQVEAFFAAYARIKWAVWRGRGRVRGLTEVRAMAWLPVPAPPAA